jgi:signal transduction histidine kinase
MTKSSGKDFESFYFTSSLRGVRIGLLLAVVLFIAFGIIVDTLFVQRAIRLGLIVPVLGITLALSWHSLFQRYFQFILSACYFIVSIGLIVMIYHTPKEAYRDVYSTGLTLCIFGASAIKLRTRAMLVVTPAILSGYIFLLYPLHKDLLMHLPLLFSASLLALLSTSYTISVMKTNFKMLSALRVERKILYDTNERLEESDLLKTKLLSIISHDLKSPINNILSLLEMHSSGSLTREELDATMKIMARRVQGTSELLNDLLAWTIYKMDGKQDFAKINLNSIVQECFYLLDDTARGKNISLVNQTPDWVVISDLKLLRLIFRNMVSNAIKFTEGGSIVCSASQTTNGSLSISVSDTGTGIPESMIERMFNWNTRFSLPGTRNEKGTGLGLLICQDFIESIGGSIWVESELGKGTTFHILLKTKICNLPKAA